MDENLDSLHNLENDGLELVPKFQMLAKEDEELPPEILLDIFDYLKPDDLCMKKLSVVCKKFYNLCSPRLRLELDFGGIHKMQRCPIINRAYHEIRVFGDEIDCNREDIGKVLNSSRASARKLVICSTRIKIRTLLFILRSLPNLKEVELDSVLGLSPKVPDKAIQPNEQPDLTNLKKLAMTLVSAVAWSAFAAAENIQELKVDVGLETEMDRDMFAGFVSKQKNLRLLQSDVYVPTEVNRTTPFVDALIGGNDIESLLKNFPKLEHLLVRPPYSSRFTQALLTVGPPNTSLKTIEIKSYFVGLFEINQILKKFPSLESFKSHGHNWSANKTAQKRISRRIC